ncbi:XRE family transcriptional regulator [Listeria monocytogenes]|nr:XRE family transcriptional regulator [Listeria monocytogenes]
MEVSNLPIGKTVKMYRNQKRWSQSMLCDKSGVPQTTISGIENKNVIPSLIIAKKLADALGVTTDDLLKESERN